MDNNAPHTDKATKPGPDAIETSETLETPEPQLGKHQQQVETSKIVLKKSFSQ
jgi:hypothetical protein